MTFKDDVCDNLVTMKALQALTGASVSTSRPGSNAVTGRERAGLGWGFRSQACAAAANVSGPHPSEYRASDLQLHAHDVQEKNHVSAGPVASVSPNIPSL